MQLEHRRFHLGIFGGSGTGKTTYALKFVAHAQAKTVFLFDAEGEFSQRLQVAPARTVYELDQAIASGWVCFDPHIMFPGDLECAGWLKLLEQSEFRDVLKSTSVLIASHHGRASGICDEIFAAGCNPYFVVISDKGYMYDTQETVSYYRSRAGGGMFRGELRHVLTTRRDGHITFRFNQNNWWPE